MSEAELKFKRFLYLCSENSKYVAVNKIDHEFCMLSEVNSIFELLKEDKENIILELIENANNDPLCARREALFYTLAVFGRNALTNKSKAAAYDAALKICKSPEELFTFIKFSHVLYKNFSQGLRRIIRTYYLKSEAEVLEKLITNFNCYYGWSHKDLIKLCHFKPTNIVQEYLLLYSMKGIKEVRKKFETCDKETDLVAFEGIMKKLENIDTLKHCNDEKEALKVMKGYEFSLSHIPSRLFKSQMIWDEIIPTLDIPELLPYLNRLNKMGILKNNSSTLNLVVQTLTDNKKCQACKIQPGQVFMYLKFFERGKPIDPQRRNYILCPDSEINSSNNKKKLIAQSNPPKNNAIVSALYKLLQHSFKNLHVTGRRVMITLDVRDEYMSHFCYANKTITCIEAAALLSYSFIKAEKHVIIAVFNGVGLKVVPIEKGINFSQHLLKLKELEGNFVLLNSPFTYSIDNKKPIDVFINMMYSPDSILRVPKENKPTESTIDALKRYRLNMHLPNTKMINISFHSAALEIADGSPHILDVCGFDQFVPKVIESCCKGVLQ